MIFLQPKPLKISDPYSQEDVMNSKEIEKDTYLLTLCTRIDFSLEHRNRRRLQELTVVLIGTAFTLLP